MEDAKIQRIVDEILIPDIRERVGGKTIAKHELVANIHGLFSIPFRDCERLIKILIAEKFLESRALGNELLAPSQSLVETVFPPMRPEPPAPPAIHVAVSGDGARVNVAGRDLTMNADIDRLADLFEKLLDRLPDVTEEEKVSWLKRLKELALEHGSDLISGLRIIFGL